MDGHYRSEVSGYGTGSSDYRYVSGRERDREYRGPGMVSGSYNSGVPNSMEPMMSMFESMMGRILEKERERDRSRDRRDKERSRERQAERERERARERDGDYRNADRDGDRDRGLDPKSV